MNARKIFTGRFRIWMLAVFIGFYFAQQPILYGADRVLIWPAEEAHAKLKSKDSLKSYEVRRGQIFLSPELLPKFVDLPENQTGIYVSKGDEDGVIINLFVDVIYEVLIDSVEQLADGTKVINGKIKDHRVGTVVMTIGPDGFIVTVQDMNRSMLYRVKGDSLQGSGTVTEIDMKKVPPMIR
jgi:hypothetical protein